MNSKSRLKNQVRMPFLVIKVSCLVVREPCSVVTNQSSLNKTKPNSTWETFTTNTWPLNRPRFIEPGDNFRIRWTNTSPRTVPSPNFTKKSRPWLIRKQSNNKVNSMISRIFCIIQSIMVLKSRTESIRGR